MLRRLTHQATAVANQKHNNKGIVKEKFRQIVKVFKKSNKSHPNGKATLTNMIFDPGLENPEALQRICLDFICKNLDSVCVRTSFTVEKEDVESDTGHDDIDMDLNFALDQLHKKLEAKISQNESKIQEKLHFMSAEDDQLLFHTKLSEELLQRLSELGEINDLVLTLFDGQKTCLKKVKIENASKLTVTGLQSLSYHNLTDLEVSNLVKATVNDLIQCLNPWTLENLKVSILRTHILSRYVILEPTCSLG